MQPSDFDLENGALLGCGSIAYVNRCRMHPDTGSTNHFAVKSVSKIQALQLHKTEGLRLEKQALTQLAFHPGIVHLHCTMQSDDEIFFVLENLTRGDLAEHIKRVSGLRRREFGEGNFNSNNAPSCLCRRDVQKILIQVILALRLVWERGFVHRDVKPENIAFHSNGRAVLIDFDTVKVGAEPLRLVSPVVQPQEKQDTAAAGTASSAAGTAASPLKMSEIQAMRRKSSAFCGTAQFVSPEALGACDWSFASDLFALGSTVYFMLAGRPVFDGASSFEVMQQIRRGVDAIPLDRWSPGVRNCAGAVSLIRTLLAPDPRRRFCKVKQSSKSQQEQEQCGAEVEFDLAAFKAHEFFSDAQDLWQRFEAEDLQFRQSEEAFLLGEKDKRRSNTSAKLKEFLISPAASTRTPCAMALAVSYTDEPRHEEEYSQYALHAGTSNLERWWLEAAEKMEGAGLLLSGDGDQAEAPRQQGEEEEQQEPQKQHEQEQPQDDAQEDETVHVVDDVGHQQFVVSNFANDGNDAE